MTAMEMVHLLGGLGLLILGANGLVRGATGAARVLGVPAFVIGLSIAAFGTSLPELMVSAHSALSGHGEIALGNVIGSNIFNVLIVLGIALLIRPPGPAGAMAKRDAPFAVFLSAALLVFCLGLGVTRLQGIFFLALLAGFVLHLFKEGTTTEEDLADGRKDDAKSLGRVLGTSGLFLLSGLVLLIFGARFFVEGAVALASSMGVGKRVIGIVIVGPGTSLPELATTIAAAVRGKMDIAVGNVVGSNIFNILAVLGVTAILAPGGIVVSPETISQDFPVLIGASVLCCFALFSGKITARVAGIVFIGGYGVYVVRLVGF